MKCTNAIRMNTMTHETRKYVYTRSPCKSLTIP
jgi:hypothetical protein